MVNPVIYNPVKYESQDHTVTGSIQLNKQLDKDGNLDSAMGTINVNGKTFSFTYTLSPDEKLSNINPSGILKKIANTVTELAKQLPQGAEIFKIDINEGAGSYKLIQDTRYRLVFSEESKRNLNALFHETFAPRFSGNLSVKKDKDL